MVRWLVRYTLSILVVLFFTISTYELLNFLPDPKAGNPGITPSSYPTGFFTPATPTVTASATVQPTTTQSPSGTPGSEELPTSLKTADVPYQTPTPRPEPYFVLQSGSPQTSVNFLNPDAECTGVGIGGQIFDLSGVPLMNYLVHLEGFFDNRSVDVLTLTGMVPQLGRGGYLFEIDSPAKGSSGMLYMQVLDMDARVLSDRIFVDVLVECEKNLLLVNFVQQPMNLNNVLFLPSITKE